MEPSYFAFFIGPRVVPAVRKRPSPKLTKVVIHAANDISRGTG